jgi:hypothetical protein
MVLVKAGPPPAGLASSSSLAAGTGTLPGQDSTFKSPAGVPQTPAGLRQSLGAGRPVSGSGRAALAPAASSLSLTNASFHDAAAASAPVTLYCANVGDSRAVLCRGGKIVELSHDHKPSRPDERVRPTHFINCFTPHVTNLLGAWPIACRLVLRQLVAKS